MRAETSARILGQFGEDPHRYSDGKARRDYAGTSPAHQAADGSCWPATGAAHQWAFCATSGVRVHYRSLRERDISHQAARHHPPPNPNAKNGMSAAICLRGR